MENNPSEQKEVKSNIFTLEKPEQQPNYRSPRRATAFLDGLRGFAAILVFLTHFTPGFYTIFADNDRGYGDSGQNGFNSFPFVRIIYSGGSAAVSIFLVLSGFVLSRSPLRLLLHDSNPQECLSSLFASAIRRGPRLYLPPFAVTFSYALLIQIYRISGIETRVPVPKESVVSEVKNWAWETVVFFQPFKTHGVNQQWYSYNFILWTLPVELKGSMWVYTLLALYAYSLSKTKSLQPSPRLFLVILSCLWFILLITRVWTMACFTAGMILCLCDLQNALDLSYLFPRLSSKDISKIQNVIFFIGWYLLCQPSRDREPERSFNAWGWYWLSCLIPQMYIDEEYFRFWQAIGSPLVIYSVLQIGWLQRFFGTRFMQYVGRVSFSLYLTHIYVGILSDSFFQRIFGQWTGAEQLGARWYDELLWMPEWGVVGLTPRYLCSLVATLLPCFAIAHVFTILIDQPSVQLSRVIAERILQKESSSR